MRRRGATDQDYQTHTQAHMHAFVGLVTMGGGVRWCLAALAPPWEEILEGEE